MSYSNLNELRVRTAASICGSLVQRAFLHGTETLSAETTQQRYAVLAVQIADSIIQYVDAYSLGRCR